MSMQLFNKLVKVLADHHCEENKLEMVGAGV